MIDLTGYQFQGMSTPGAPAADAGPWLAIVVLHTPGGHGPESSYYLHQCEGNYHLWWGDWLRCPAEIWHAGGSDYRAIAQTLARRRVS